MLARGLAATLPAMRLADALEAMHMPRVAARTGARIALIVTNLGRVPP